MKRFIPGTTLEYNERARNEAFSLICPIIEVTGGLTLSQLSKLSGIEGTTIQNWIKRGWVSSTVGKKYSRKQIIRILLINMLRGSMNLEKIANLMQYVNGDVDDTSDDIIDDVLLFNVLCKIIFVSEEIGAFDKPSLKLLIDAEIQVVATKIKVSENEKLKNAMLIMILAYRSAYLKNEMENVYKLILD